LTIPYPAKPHLANLFRFPEPKVLHNVDTSTKSVQKPRFQLSNVINSNDPAGKLHLKFYNRSDKANARSNQNAEWQEGFAIGVETVKHDARSVIDDEQAVRKQVGDDQGAGFAEWKRGFLAARGQFVAMGLTPKRKRKE
jgi:hypothetical protein